MEQKFIVFEVLQCRIEASTEPLSPNDDVVLVEERIEVVLIESVFLLEEEYLHSNQLCGGVAVSLILVPSDPVLINLAHQP